MNKIERKILRTNKGKLATVDNSITGLQLVVEDVQVQYIMKHEVRVKTWTTAEEGTRLAFFFTGTKTVPKVSGDLVQLDSTVKLEERNEQNSLDESYLFKWKDLGGGRCLQSVSEPQKHLTVDTEDKVVLSSNDQEFALFELCPIPIPIL